LGNKRETINVRRLWESVLNPPQVYAIIFQHSFYLKRKGRMYKIIHNVDVNPNGKIDNQWYVADVANIPLSFGIRELLIRRAKELERDLIRKTMVEKK